MDITIKINCDNDDFSRTPARTSARILRKLADDMEAYECLNGEIEEGRTLRDCNGNTVGRMEVSD